MDYSKLSFEILQIHAGHNRGNAIYPTAAYRFPGCEYAADPAKAGVTPTLLRISDGLEYPADIIADFEQTFKAA
ncbi:MAG: PLP-dependent transferase [Muribaculaceae bacterium]|nr:PLP-dependent transferase [Muribaculaceae bacterium]